MMLEHTAQASKLEMFYDAPGIGSPVCHKARGNGTLVGIMKDGKRVVRSVLARLCECVLSQLHLT
jgi:hypothetical protein